MGEATNHDGGKPSLSELISHLDANLKIVKDEYSQFCKETKDTLSVGGSFPGNDIVDAIQDLGVKYESLKKKYVEESSERKRLYNEVVELRGNIRVFCRCRPLTPDEVQWGTSSVVEFDPLQDTEFQVVVPADNSRKPFRFDHIFSPQDNQERVFAQTGPVIMSVLDGYNVCIFAYGQTGTGKTFTMEGTPEDRGVNYRSLEKLFNLAKEREETMNYSISVSMLEVYNDKIRDLLEPENGQQPTKKLDIKQVGEGVHEIPGLAELAVSNTEEVWEAMKAGARERAVGSTNANEESSRSHCLLKVVVKGKNLLNGCTTKSHLWLVDLAGSERVGKLDVQGERLKESQSINKSLSALGDVISALATKQAHIPYRNSKLTHLLQSALGGDCKTLMIVQISPSAKDIGETLCSLNFATRVRGVEHGPARKQQQSADQIDPFKYKQMIGKLKQDEKESRKMQESIQILQLKFKAREHLCKTLQDKVRELETQLLEERKMRMQQDSRALAATTANDVGLTKKKPPLCPSKQQRQPLSRANRLLLPPIDPKKNLASFMGSSSSVGKENVSANSNPSSSPLAGAVSSMMRARRVSLASYSSGRENNISSTASLSTITESSMRARRVSVLSSLAPSATRLPKPRRTSIAVMPQHPDSRRLSLVRDLRRRVSRMFTQLPLPPPPPSSAVEATPDSNKNGKRRFIMSSPNHVPWIPTLPTVSSPRLHRPSTVSSPINLRGLKNAQTLNKFCSSVQRKVSSSSGLLSSPQLLYQQQHHHRGLLENIDYQIQQSKAIGIGKLGSAQRVLYNGRKRRASIQC